MAVYKDKDRGTWYATFFIVDWQGERKRHLKRGFATKREAQEYERVTLMSGKGDLSIKFEDFIELYTRDLKSQMKLNTWQTKENILKTKIMPYFKGRKINEITTSDIIQWQNEMIRLKNKNDMPLSCVYLKTLQNQLSAIFNHAVRVYDLKFNPVSKTRRIGRERSLTEVQFWTKEDYTKFADYIMDKPMSFYAFEVLYWCGLRLGEMLALTPLDFNFIDKTVRVNKSYQCINREDIVTTPKTVKSNRTISMPDFLVEEIKEFVNSQYKLKTTDRIFTLSKTTLHKDLKRGSELLGLKKIKLHALRHSHVSLLIEMGFTPLAIAERVGHESITITYQYAHLFPNKQAEIANGLNSLRGDV